MNAIPEKTELLAELIATGNRKAFDMFYNLYYRQVYRTAYYYLADTEACREVVSNVFVALWRGREKLKSVDNIDSYLFICAKNESLRWLTRTEAEQNVVRMSEFSVPLEIDAQMPADIGVELDDLQNAINKAVASLPEKCRIIFLMSREEDMNNGDIARHLNIAESTVRVQLKNAVERIVASIRNSFPNITLPMCLMLLFV